MLSPSNIARWFEAHARPGRMLALMVLALYGWTATGPFFIDDYRNLRLMREYREGRRSELGLYQFLRGDADNARLRAAGYYPWWIADDVRYRHARPVTEWWLYGEYRLFGDRPIGYHCVSLLMYVGGVILVSRLFSLLTDSRRLARWAALFFAVAGGHAVAVTFLSMQCDLLGLLLVGASLCFTVRYARDGGWGRLAMGVVLFGVALGAKESTLPAATLPLLIGWAVARPGALRRGRAATAVMLAIGAVWLGIYAAHGYGANNAMMLDPIHAPGHYLRELGVRALVLLSTWLVPINPFLFYLRPFGRPIIPVLAGVGVLSLLIFGYLIRRNGRLAAAAAVWTLGFLPLLVCTVPDDRNLLLPGVGLALLAAMWAVGPRRDGRSVVRVFPVLLFLVAQLGAGPVNAAMIRHLQGTVQRNMDAAIESFGRPTAAGDCIFFLNLDTDPQVLFCQDMLDQMRVQQGQPADLRVEFLCEIRQPTVTKIDDHTLRIRGETEPLLEGFLGKMGHTQERGRREGDVFDAGVFQARIVRIESEQVRELEIRFAEPLTSEHYRFIWCTPGERPERRSFGPEAVSRPSR